MSDYNQQERRIDIQPQCTCLPWSVAEMQAFSIETERALNYVQSSFSVLLWQFLLRCMLNTHMQSNESQLVQLTEASSIPKLTEGTYAIYSTTKWPNVQRMSIADNHSPLFEDGACSRRIKFIFGLKVPHASLKLLWLITCNESSNLLQTRHLVKVLLNGTVKYTLPLLRSNQS